ncbi:hypothetical protein CC86DRAFT_365635 [Ophiobolus disseminans]|uniref:Uncharacterized protein n=1 Tax=Ophiobolus disseminans TaxID=1469910 RepID=A0A6A7AKR5_9PLEO|nr:hypothetical protein CC86DRAFT_365635 [Ophiobolus disseminans]
MPTLNPSTAHQTSTSPQTLPGPDIPAPPLPTPHQRPHETRNNRHDIRPPRQRD